MSFQSAHPQPDR